MVHSVNLYQINDSPLERSNNRTIFLHNEWFKSEPLDILIWTDFVPANLTSIMRINRLYMPYTL